MRWSQVTKNCDEYDVKMKLNKGKWNVGLSVVLSPLELSINLVRNLSLEVI